MPTISMFYGVIIRPYSELIRYVDAGHESNKGVFTELKDEAYFRQARVAFGAVSWPNEQDLSHDTLYLLGIPV